jgi:integrase
VNTSHEKAESDMGYGEGRVFERRGNLWVSYCYRGKEYRERACDERGKPTNDQTKAVKYLKRRRDAIATENGGGPQFETSTMRRLTIHDLLEDLKAKYQANGQDSAQNLCVLKRADADLGHLLACGATAKHFRDYRASRPDATTATVNRILQAVRAAYRLALKRGEVARVPYIEVLSEKGNERQGFASDAQINAVLAALPDDGLRDFVEWGAETGERKSEIAALTWAMYDAVANQLHIPSGVCKNRKPRTIALGSTLQLIIERRKAARRVVSIDGTAQLSAYIFHRDGLPVGDFKKSWHTATKAAKCEGFLFHDLRRTVARRLLAAGVPTQVAKTITGHESDSIFSRYAIIDAALQLAAQEKVAAFVRQAAK